MAKTSFLHQTSHDGYCGQSFTPLTFITTSGDAIVEEPWMLCGAHLRFKQPKTEYCNKRGQSNDCEVEQQQTWL